MCANQIEQVSEVLDRHAKFRKEKELIDSVYILNKPFNKRCVRKTNDVCGISNLKTFLDKAGKRKLQKNRKKKKIKPIKNIYMRKPKFNVKVNESKKVVLYKKTAYIKRNLKKIV